VPYAAVNGLNMYYEVRGDGPPLLLLHGGSGSIAERWIPCFADRFQVIAIEQTHVGAEGTANPACRRPSNRASRLAATGGRGRVLHDVQPAREPARTRFPSSAPTCQARTRPTCTTLRSSEMSQPSTVRPSRLGGGPQLPRRAARVAIRPHRGVAPCHSKPSMT
jgi:hypothetical protein